MPIPQSERIAFVDLAKDFCDSKLHGLWFDFCRKEGDLDCKTECLDCDSDGHIVKIDFNEVKSVYWHRNSLKADLPPLNSFPHLKIMRFKHQRIQGPLNSLPETLEELVLQNCELTGNIPTLPPRLRVLDLAGNELRGPLPELPSTIEHLSLGYNSLGGEIPSSYGTQPNLVRIGLERNNLQGTIPSSLLSSSSLQELDLSDNNLQCPDSSIPPNSGLKCILNNNPISCVSECISNSVVNPCVYTTCIKPPAAQPPTTTPSTTHLPTTTPSMTSPPVTSPPITSAPSTANASSASPSENSSHASNIVLIVSVSLIVLSVGVVVSLLVCVSMRKRRRQGRPTMQEMENRSNITTLQPLDASQPLLTEAVSIISDTSRLPWSIPTELFTMGGWVEKGTEKLGYKSLLLKNGNTVTHEEEAEFAIELCQKLQTPPNWAVRAIYMIQNETLSGNFNGNLKMIAQRWRADPKLFRKDNWKVKSPGDLRSWYMEHFNREVKKYEELNTSREGESPVLWLVHGTKGDSVWKICQSGFGRATITDDGHYGAGVYFSNSINYSQRYSEGSGVFGPFLVCLVATGNPYPVTESPSSGEESLQGAPIFSGYQSHFSMVNTNGEPALKRKKWVNLMEVVIDQESQALPRYVVYFEEKGVEKGKNSSEKTKKTKKKKSSKKAAVVADTTHHEETDSTEETEIELELKKKRTKEEVNVQEE